MGSAARTTTLLLLLPLLLGARRARAWSWNGPPAPRFAVVPASAVRQGQGQVQVLEQGAEAESLLDRIMGRNCFSTAVAELTADCRRMEQEQKTRLALSMTNCQLAVQGSDTYPCSRRKPLRECTEALSERAHSLFVEFLTHADTMCLYIQNQNFEKYTENMLNRLSEGAGYAREQLASVAKSTGALAGDTAALKSRAEAALAMLQEHKQLEEESLRLQRAARDEAASYFESLDGKQQLALALQDAALQRQAALESAQHATLSALGEARSAVGSVFELVEGRAAELAAAAGQQAAAQQRLAGELTALVDDSKGIRSAVDVVLTYQQRSDSVLMRLLGKSYTLEDAAFYGAGVLAAFAAGVSPATARAKLPVAALMGASLLGERMLVDRLHMLLDVDESGQIVANLPVPLWLAPARAAAGAPMLFPLNLKWAVRRAAAVLAAAMVLYCAWSYRDLERESYKMLHQLEEEQRRRHQEYLSLLNQHKVQMAALLGGAGGDSSGRDALPRRPAAPKAAAVLPEAAPFEAAGGGQLVPRGGGRRGPPVIEEDDVWAEDEGGSEQGGSQLSGSQLSDPVSADLPRRTGTLAAAAPPPAAAPSRSKGGRVAKSAPAAPRRSAAAAAPSAAGRKRGVSDGAEGDSAPACAEEGSKKRSGRRASAVAAADASGAEAMAVDGRKPVAGKRRGSANQASATPKRPRRG